MSKPYNEELCRGCERRFRRTDAGGRDKWLCFGITSCEGRTANNIPDSDKLRLCIKHPPPKKLPVENLFQLNINEMEAEVLKNGLEKLIRITKNGRESNV
jgi:hypothetical protein